MTEIKKGKIFRRRGGCNEDCFHCKYPDCYKPDYTLKSDKVFVGTKTSDNRYKCRQLRQV